MSNRYLDEAWDQAHELILELGEKGDFDTTLSLDEFYAEYYYNLSYEDRERIEKTLKLWQVDTLKLWK
jgi:hypothetical protein